MNLLALHDLAALEEHKHFGRAAQACHIREMHNRATGKPGAGKGNAAVFAAPCPVIDTFFQPSFPRRREPRASGCAGYPPSRV